MNVEEITMDTVYYSVINNDFKLLKDLEEKGVDILAENSKAFLLACEYGHFRIVEYLLDKGANINATVDFDPIPTEYSLFGNALSLSISNNTWLVFEYLLEKSIKVDLDNSFALKRLASINDIYRAKELIRRGANVNDSEALSVAVIDNNWDFVKYLLTETDADIHADNDFALRSICLKGNLELIELLLEKGADVNAIPSILQDIDDYGFNETALTCSIAGEQWETFNYLLENGADPNINNQEPFIQACILDGYNPMFGKVVSYYLKKELVVFNNKVFDAVVKAPHLDLLKYFLNEYPHKDIDEKSLLQNESIYKYDRAEIFDYLLGEGYELTQETRDMLVKENKDKFLSILMKYDLSEELSVKEEKSKRMKV